MRLFHFIVISATLLSSCVSTGSNYQQKLMPWIGRSQQELYSEWGAPMQITPVNNQSFIATYYKSETAPIDNDFEPYIGELSYNAIAVPDYGLPPTTPLFYCKTSFVIQNGYITDFNFAGDDCY